MASDDGVRANDVYARLGIQPFINCCGTRTVHGGSLMHPVVVAAMAEVADRFVNLNELVLAAGRRIAELTGAESALITSGAAAALIAATAAAMTKGDPERMLALPKADGMPRRVLMPKGARFTYDHAIRTAGAEIVEVADAAALATALKQGAAMVATIGTKDAELPIRLEELAALARPHGVPVLIDAASEHLGRPVPYLARGATFVAYSGGKYLRGPQSTGLLLGQRAWIEAARLNAAPHHAIGRPMKISKEEVVGILTAVEHWATGRNHDAEQVRWSEDLAEIARRVMPVAGVATEILPPGKPHEQVPRLRISWERGRVGLDGLGLRETLLNGRPRIMLDDRGATESSVFILPFSLEAGEAAAVGNAIAAALAASPPAAAPPPPAPVADLSGDWLVEIDFAADRGRHRLALRQTGDRLAGTHATLRLEAPVAGRIAGAAVEFASLHPFEGSNLSYAFSGTLTGGEISGTVLLGTSGDSAPGPLNMREFGSAVWRARRAD